MAVYLVCFSEPMKGGQRPRHYLGATDKDPQERLQEHIKGINRPARIIQAAIAQGITVEITRVWPEHGYELEKYLKQRKKGFKGLCPKCTPILRRQS